MTGLRLILVGAAVGVLTAVVVACGGGSASSTATGKTVPALVRTTVIHAAPVGSTTVGTPRQNRRTSHAPIVQRLSAQQLAGQRIIYSYAGLKPPASLLSAIRAGEAGGVIFFAPNVSSVSQLRGVVAQLQRAALASPLHTRLLMLTDQEGGEVRRLPGAPALSEKQIGQSSNGASLAASAGAGAAGTLSAAGLNVNLAPVLDVYRHAGNFIDEFQRSYSSNPATVARLGRAFITAQQRKHVAATAKHFPGLGAAGRSQNTDLRPVKLSMSLATAARGRRGALQKRDRRRRQAGDVLLGDVSGARREPPGRAVVEGDRRRAARSSWIQGRDDHRRDRCRRSDAVRQPVPPGGPRRSRRC